MPVEYNNSIDYIENLPQNLLNIEEDSFQYKLWRVFSDQFDALDIAFACIQYAYASADSLFIEREVWPLLAGVCAWIASRVVRTPRGYEIHHVVGVDESIDNIDNNSYTNIAARIVLEESCRIAERLGIEVPATIRALANEVIE